MPFDRHKREERDERDLDGRTRTQKIRELHRRRHLQRKRRIKQEAREQTGPDDMHNEPDVEMRAILDASDRHVREPDAIRSAEEYERIALGEEKRMHRDRDLEAVDDIEALERQDFEVI